MIFDWFRAVGLFFLFEVAIGLAVMLLDAWKPPAQLTIPYVLSVFAFLASIGLAFRNDV